MDNYKHLEKIAAQARLLVVQTVINSGVGHLGGSLSCIDILIALYFNILNIDPKNMNCENRDRFILSKGHASIGLYSILALKGFITFEILKTFRKDGSILGGHPDSHIPGVEHGTGSLGHGLSIGVGMALAGKVDKKKYRVFVLLGDGETQEGQIWEAAMAAAHYKLDNLVAVIDRNRLQIDGFTEDIMSLGNIRNKWEAFGWEVNEINGHCFDSIIPALNNIPFQNDKPSLLIANTIKGKGVDFMENQIKWHGGAPKGDEADKAIEILKRNLDTSFNE